MKDFGNVKMCHTDRSPGASTFEDFFAFRFLRVTSTVPVGSPYTVLVTKRQTGFQTRSVIFSPM